MILIKIGIGIITFLLIVLYLIYKEKEEVFKKK